ncbi:zinc finger CCCH domain-containing protein 15-like [Ptychodera flava]|uniref:zinc finger CCCH domain-containing protein 15-like n=1 Tax=Ptychodera flava TaxID=63121 RepID=UPI00396A5584
MPPKKQAQGASKKTEQKKKERIIEDKTFGLKNKKGAKQQQFIKQVTQQVKSGGQKSARQLQKEQEEAKLKKKDTKKKEQDELNALFKPVQKVSKGADPKSIVCAFYKQGACTKGDKCKFSHDLTMERKAEKRSLYVDTRDDELKKDNMEDWDEAKLAEVVAKKHGDQNKKQTSTEIVCKYFLQAIEECKYGWFWICPNGGDKCMYRHALPPGFVLKKNKKKDDVSQEDTITMEELIEEERAKLGSNHPKITLESFLAWKQTKIREKKKKLEADTKKRKEDFKQGRSLGISGREVFEFKPELADDDDEGADDTKYVREEGEEEEKVEATELTLEALAASATTADKGCATVATAKDTNNISTTKPKDLTNHLQKDNPSDTDKNIPETNGPLQNISDETNKLDQAAALPVDETAAAIAAAEAALLDETGVQIDEQLFTDDVPVDEQLFDAELEGLDEDLDTLDLHD